MRKLLGFLAWFVRPPRKISFTREGWIFTLFTLPLGLAAINTGNNMLYLILGMLLSVIALNGFLSESSMRKIRIVSQPPDYVFAGQSFVSFVDVSNDKKYFPSYLLRISPLWRPTQWATGLSKRKRRTAKPAAIQAGYAVKISAGGQQRLRLSSTFENRGEYLLSGYELATLFPFGLFDKSRELGDARDTTHRPQRLLVYPQPLRVDTHDTNSWLAGGDLDLNQRGHGGDLYAFRTYHTDDDARAIHWKLSAKAGRTIVREYAATGKRKVLIQFDPRLETKLLKKGHVSLPHPPFERAVSQIAYLVQGAFEQDLEFGLLTPDAQFAPASGVEQFHRIMAFLSMVQPVVTPDSKRLTANYSNADVAGAFADFKSDEVILIRVQEKAERTHVSPRV